MRKPSLTHFFIASLVLHLFFLLTWHKLPVKAPPPSPIIVTLEPQVNPERAIPTPIPEPAPRRPSRSKAIIAQKSTPLREEAAARPAQPTAPMQSLAPVQPAAPKEPKADDRPAREPERESLALAERRLPTLKDLLPPLAYSSGGQRSGKNDGPVRLDTRDPQFITYFGSIKRAIELVWEYPELALKYGLQGRLVMEFSVLGNGQLGGARIIRSSGSNLLDEEALRAIKTASPFSPIPPWIGKERLDIIASFEYHDNRLNYRFMP